MEEISPISLTLNSAIKDCVPNKYLYFNSASRRQSTRVSAACTRSGRSTPPGRMSTTTLSPWTSWEPSGSSSPSGPGRSSGQSQNMTSWAQTWCQRQHFHQGLHGRFQAPRRHPDQAGAQGSLKIWRHELRHDVSDNTLTMDFHGRFQATRGHPDQAGTQVSLKIYYVTSSGMMSMTTPSPWTSWALSGSSSPSGPGQSSGQSQNMTSWAQTWCQWQHSHHGLHGRFQAPRRHPDLARAQVRLTTWRHELRNDFINPPSCGLNAWAPSGSSMPSGPCQSSGKSQNMTSRAQTDDFSCNSYLKKWTV